MKKNDSGSMSIALFFLIFLVSSCIGQPESTVNSEHSSSSQIRQEIDKLISTYAEYGEFNGSILVSKKNEIIYKKGFGLANMEWNIPNQTDTKFRIGSITKQFTAMLIVQLAAEKKVDLHTPISAYLPDYPKENGDRITIHHLLTHTSGIPNNYESKTIKVRRPDNYSAEYLVNEFSDLPLEFSPGEKFSYCNAGYTLLGLIIEKITNKRYETTLQERIFTPLKMKNTGFDKHRALIKDRASGYFKNWGEYYNANYIDMSKVYAAGALYSTVEDLHLWDRALYTDQLIPEAYRKLIFTPHIPDPGYGGHYGYGWSLVDRPLGNSSETVPAILHDGVIDGFCAIFTRVPSSEISIVLLSNVRRAPLNAMTKGIMGILYDKPYDLPLKSLAYSLLEVIDQEGVNKGMKHYQSTKDNQAYYLVEDEINIVSYKLLQSNRAEAAAKVLELGIEAFPNAFNLYDSYGEVLRSLGRKEEAIENYKKSVELNPENENGVKMLRELEAEMDH